MFTDKAIVLFDGTMIFGYWFLSQDPNEKTDNMMHGRVGLFYIDVNGPKRPNKLGRDVFDFWLGDNGIVYPHGSQAASEYESNGNKSIYYWNTSNNYNSSLCRIDKYGVYCAARVLEEGKMNY